MHVIHTASFSEGVVKLFRLINRVEKINREILAFSVSHEYRPVRIYGYYTMIGGLNTTFYHYPTAPAGLWIYRKA